MGAACAPISSKSVWGSRGKKRMAPGSAEGRGKSYRRVEAESTYLMSSTSLPISL
jgi:hypothetical protein